MFVIDEYFELFISVSLEAKGGIWNLKFAISCKIVDFNSGECIRVLVDFSESFILVNDGNV